MVSMPINIMKPLSQIFRPPPSSPLTLDAQIAALETATPDLIAATAVSDGEEALRAAAVRKLPDGEVLRLLAGLNWGASGTPSALERAAQERVAALVDAGSIGFTELRSNGNAAAVLSVAGHCANAVYLTDLLGSITDMRHVATLVIEGSSSRIRQLAAQRIEDPAELSRLLRLARDKDKSVYKILKQKSDALRAEQERIAQIASDVNGSCASLEHIGQRVYDANYAASFEYYQAQWRKVEALAALEIQQRARLAIDRCRKVIDGHLHQLAEQAAETSRHAEQLAAREASREAAIVQAAEEAQRRSEAEALATAEAAKEREVEEKARAERLAAEAAALRRIGGLIGQVNSLPKTVWYREFLSNVLLWMTSVSLVKWGSNTGNPKIQNNLIPFLLLSSFLHMDLFGPVNVRSIGHKYYCLVITDYFSRFSWVFF